MSELSDLGVKYADKPRTRQLLLSAAVAMSQCPLQQPAEAAASMGTAEQRFGNSTQLSFAVMNRTKYVNECLIIGSGAGYIAITVFVFVTGVNQCNR